MFKTYFKVKDKNVLLGDSHSTIVAGTCEVELKFISVRVVTLKDVLQPLEMRKILVSRYLFNKVGFTQVFGADMYTLTKKNMFVGKRYSTDGMFKLNIAINKNTSSVLYVLLF